MNPVGVLDGVESAASSIVLESGVSSGFADSPTYIYGMNPFSVAVCANVASDEDDDDDDNSLGFAGMDSSSSSSLT